MTLSSYAFSHCSAPRAPGVRPGASKSDFEGAATAGGLVRGASSRSGLRSRRALLGRTAASCWCPGRSHGQTGTLMISSGSAHLSDTCFHCPSSCRSDIAIKVCSLDFIRKPTNMPDSILSSAFDRSVNGPNRYHTRSPHAHLPMWCRRLRHRSNGTFPSDPTVSRFSNVVACPII